MQPEKSSFGRPPKYRSEFAEQARRYCLLGAIDKQLAEFFAVSDKTIENWRRKYPDFKKACIDGKAVADARVAEGIYRSAIGAVTIKIRRKTINESGLESTSEEERELPPDVGAATFWLKNRQPSNWRERIEQQINHGDSLSAEVLDERYVRRMREAHERQLALLAERAALFEGQKK